MQARNDWREVCLAPLTHCGYPYLGIAGGVNPTLVGSESRSLVWALTRTMLRRDNTSDMLTDAPPRDGNRTGFLKSDGLNTLDLPDNGRLPLIAQSIESAMKTGKTADVRVSCAEFLAEVSQFYRVPPCGIRVLAARPLRVREQWTTELFGDYNIETMVIRLWMRTAVRKEITSYGTFLSTLCHEFCHHLDFHLFKFADSWHTRGFFERTAALYHYAKGTPRKKLFWAPVPGGRWRIDWQRTTRAAERGT